MARWFAGLALAVWAVVAAGSANAADGAATTVLSLRETAEARVAPNILVLTLRAEATGDSPAKVQQAVNRLMADALATAKRAEAIRAETGGYAVYSARDPAAGQGERGRILWRASQGLTLTSSHFTTLLDVAGTLQTDGLLLSGMSFDLSPELRRDLQTRLVADAIGQLRREADSAALALGLKVMSFRALRVDKGAAAPMMRRAVAGVMAAAPGVAPVAEPGDQTVEVAVEADIVLSP